MSSAVSQGGLPAAERPPLELVLGACALTFVASRNGG